LFFYDVEKIFWCAAILPIRLAVWHLVFRAHPTTSEFKIFGIVIVCALLLRSTFFTDVWCDLNPTAAYTGIHILSDVIVYLIAKRAATVRQFIAHL